MKFTAAALTASLFALGAVASPLVARENDKPKKEEHKTEPPKHDDGKKGDDWKKMDHVFTFTSTYDIEGTPDQVRNGTTPAPGAPDAYGIFKFGINSIEDVICYNITLLNVVGPYQSPAATATHIHEAAYGVSGPPRIAFPNPVGDDERRVSVGCLTGPFRTGLNGTDGQDTGLGFTVAEIEANPAGFFADSHTAAFPLGVVRGNLA